MLMLIVVLQLLNECMNRLAMGMAVALTFAAVLWCVLQITPYNSCTTAHSCAQMLGLPCHSPTDEMRLNPEHNWTAVQLCILGIHAVKFASASGAPHAPPVLVTLPINNQYPARRGQLQAGGTALHQQHTALVHAAH
jgi:hypothetical protein